MMAEKPILFNTEMVRAIQEGRKTQTRRIIKGLPLYPPFLEVDEGRGWLEDSESGTFYALEAFSKVQPGDVLYVRETWALASYGYIYRADRDSPGFVGRWYPSIHMPRKAARIFLKVKDIRAERLQEITSGEAVAEGIKSNLRSPSEAADALIAFEELWNGTIKPSDFSRYGWKANPWVWVVEFERINKPNGWCES